MVMEENSFRVQEFRFLRRDEQLHLFLSRLSPTHTYTHSTRRLMFDKIRLISLLFASSSQGVEGVRGGRFQVFRGAVNPIVTLHQFSFINNWGANGVEAFKSFLRDYADENPRKQIQGTYPNAIFNDEHLHSNLKQTAHKKYQFIFSFKTNYLDGVGAT